MARIRSLNGLPNELTQRYISTMMYYERGYMPDWIAKQLAELNITAAEINIFTESSIPIDFISKPIKVYFKDLRKQIEESLVKNGFDPDFINQGYFKVHVSRIDHAFGQVSVQCILIDKNNRSIVGKIYSEQTFPIAETFFERIWKSFMKR